MLSVNFYVCVCGCVLGDYTKLKKASLPPCCCCCCCVSFLKGSNIPQKCTPLIMLHVLFTHQEREWKKSSPRFKFFILQQLSHHYFFFYSLRISYVFASLILTLNGPIFPSHFSPKTQTSCCLCDETQHKKNRFSLKHRGTLFSSNCENKQLL